MPEMGNLCLETDFAAWTLRVGVLLALLCPVLSKANTLDNPEHDPFPVLHEWYQPGDFIIGGITSQFTVTLHNFKFENSPSQQLSDSPG
ncbi:UNVERIFIED_CONTAM: hypothetical protein K2H54_044109, partial [Gekko kuhli]